MLFVVFIEFPLKATIMCLFLCMKQESEILVTSGPWDTFEQADLALCEAL